MPLLNQWSFSYKDFRKKEITNKQIFDTIETGSESMDKKHTIKKNSEFNEIIQTAPSKKNELFVIYYKENKYNNSRFGISVGKKIGKAVIRNLYKRRLRNIIDHQKKLYSKHLDYIIILRRNCLSKTFQEMEQLYIDLIQRIDYVVNKGANNEKTK